VKKPNPYTYLDAGGAQILYWWRCDGTARWWFRAAAGDSGDDLIFRDSSAHRQTTENESQHHQWRHANRDNQLHSIISCFRRCHGFFDIGPHIGVVCGGGKGAQLKADVHFSSPPL